MIFLTGNFLNLLMAKPKKSPKQKATKYDEKVSIKGSFADVFKVVKKNKEDKQPKKSK